MHKSTNLNTGTDLSTRSKTASSSTRQQTEKQEPEQESRRSFLRTSGAALSAGICGLSLGALLQSCADEQDGDSGITEPDPDPDSDPDSDPGQTAGLKIDVRAEAALQAPGGFIQRRFADFNDGHPLIVIRAEADTFLVCSALCTHERCIVEPPRPSDGKIVCPCHDSEFSSLDGSWIAGPAQRGLWTFNSRYDAVSGELSVGRRS